MCASLDFLPQGLYHGAVLQGTLRAKERDSMENRKSFGAFLLQRRKELGMTQKEFANRLFVTDSAVSKWERGVSQS